MFTVQQFFFYAVYKNTCLPFKQVSYFRIKTIFMYSYFPIKSSKIYFSGDHQLVLLESFVMPISDREVSEPPAKRRKGDGNAA